MASLGPRVAKRPLLSYLAIFVVVPVATYLTGSWLDGEMNFPRIPPFPYNLIIGFAILFTGLAVGIKSTRLLYKLGAGLPWGEVRLDDQSSRLVTTSLYSYTRNPIVLGYSMLPLGMGLIFQSIGMAVTMTSISLVFNILLVKFWEEKRLFERFGNEYRDYRNRTPFLIPRLGQVLQALSDWRRGYIKLALTPLLGLAVLVGLAYQFQSPSINYQREYTATIFSLICFVGAVAGIYPRKVSRLLRKNAEHRNESGEGYLGHHPTCRSYSTHVFNIYGGTYCSGCIGLVLGAIIGVVYTLLSLPLVNPLKPELIFSIGLPLTVLGVLQHVFDNNSPIIHSALNVSLVLGVAITRVGAQVLNGGIVVDVYALALTLYIVTARIDLSQNDHRMICEACDTNPCRYSYALEIGAS